MAIIRDLQDRAEAQRASNEAWAVKVEEAQAMADRLAKKVRAEGPYPVYTGHTHQGMLAEDSRGCRRQRPRACSAIVPCSLATKNALSTVPAMTQHAR